MPVGPGGDEGGVLLSSESSSSSSSSMHITLATYHLGEAGVPESVGERRRS